MADRFLSTLTCIVLVAAAGGATAMELDTLLPTEIPGYGTPRLTSVLDRTHPEYNPVNVDIAGLTLAPKIEADAGFDSSPNGAGGASGLYDVNPSLLALDTELGLGAYVAGTYTTYPEAADQDLAGYTIAIGERVVLPRETLTFSAAAVAVQETSFALNTFSIEKPIRVLVKDVRGSDAIICGMATLTPQVSATNYRFGDIGSQDRTDYRQSLTTEITPGGPARFVTLLHATESIYRNSAFNADTYSALAGIADQSLGLWNIRLLAGAALRRPVTGGALTAPVLEASIGWMPGDLDSVQIDAAREIDDPDQESANGYTLTEADISIAHEYLRNVIFQASFKFSHATYFNTRLIESLYSANTAVDWHLNRALALNATYAFNDRQANFLNAANQHIFTLGVTWSP